MLAGQLRDLEERRDLLRVYVHELQLDDATLKEGGHLFQVNCQHCHGMIGDGDGKGGSRDYRPLPRDYRQGLFKFMSTDPALGGKRKPSRADLFHTISHGTEEASGMPEFQRMLNDEQIRLLISYVIHLSIRGETEYEVMKEAADPAVNELTPADIRGQLFKEAADSAQLGCFRPPPHRS